MVQYNKSICFAIIQVVYKRKSKYWIILKIINKENKINYYKIVRIFEKVNNT